MEVMQSTLFYSVTPLPLPPCAEGLIWDIEENACLPDIEDASDVEIRAPVPDTRCKYGYYFHPVMKVCTRKKYHVTKGAGNFNKWWQKHQTKSTRMYVPRPMPTPEPPYTGEYWKYNEFGRDRTRLYF